MFRFSRTPKSGGVKACRRGKKDGYYRWENYGKIETHQDKEMSSKALERRHEKDTVMDLSVFPVGNDELTTSKYVADTSTSCSKLALKHMVSPTGTIVEGSIDDCLQAIKETAEKSLHRTPRIILQATLDIRPGEFGRFDRKRAKIREVIQETGEKFDESETESIHNKY